MSLARSIGTGGPTTSSARVILRRNITVVAAAVDQTQPIQVIGLSRVFFWVLQTAGANPATLDFQFSVASETPGPQEEWLVLDSTIGPALTVPAFWNFTVPARATRLQVTAPAGNDVTLQLVIGAVT